MDDINGYDQKSAAASGPANLSLAESLHQHHVIHCICFVLLQPCEVDTVLSP
jgi:hypothetical protein